MTITAIDFISLQVRDLERAAAFYSDQLGLTRASFSPPHAVVFQTSPAFAVRTALPGVELGHPGEGVALWLQSDATQQLHDELAAAGIPIVTAPFDGPFGRTFTFSDPDGYAVTVHDVA